MLQKQNQHDLSDCQLIVVGCCMPHQKRTTPHKRKVSQILKFTDDILELKQVCNYCVVQFHILITRLHGMLRDLHCNPMKVVVSGKVLFVPGGRKWDSLRD